MPPAYVSVADYVTAYGDQEAIRLTSETQPPARIDAKIEAAIIDAEEVVEGYVSRRYALPLANVPRVLQTWVKALAREILHKTRPLPEVIAAADRARQQLKEVALGYFKLTVDDGTETPLVGGESLSMTSGDAREETFTESKMDAYQNFDGPQVPNWRQ